MSANLTELKERLNPDDTVGCGYALDELKKIDTPESTELLLGFIKIAPAGLLTMKAAMTLEKRQDPSTVPALYEVYSARPDLAEDIIPILSALEDDEGVLHIIGDLRDLMSGPARMSTLAYLVKCADPGAIADLLLPLVTLDPIQGAADDIMWALEHILTNADDETLLEIGTTAKELGEEAYALVERYMPQQSEVEQQAPVLARALLRELERKELVELVPGAEDALVEMLSRSICEARSPKGPARLSTTLVS